MKQKMFRAAMCPAHLTPRFASILTIKLQQHGLPKALGRDANAQVWTPVLTADRKFVRPAVPRGWTNQGGEMSKHEDAFIFQDEARVWQSRALAAEKEIEMWKARFLSASYEAGRALNTHDALAAELEEVREALEGYVDYVNDKDNADEIVPLGRIKDAQLLLSHPPGARGKEILAERDRYREVLERIIEEDGGRAPGSGWCSKFAQSALAESGK